MKTLPHCLLLTEVFPPRIGGSGRYLWEIYSRLSSNRVSVLAGQTPGQAAFDRTHCLRLERLDLSFPTWGVASVAGVRSYWRTWRHVRTFLKASRVDEVHAGKCLPEGLLAWLLRQRLGVPYRCYAYGEELNLAAQSRELRFWTRRVLHGAASVIAISRNTERILLGEWGLPAERVRLLHPGVDTSVYVPAPRDTATRGRLRWFDRPVVLTVGRLQKRKGQDMMIRALGAIRQAVPDVLFAVAGDGEERRSLQELAAAEGVTANVQFLGEVDDALLLQAYQQCDLFALPNRQVDRDIEGFGIVLLEAQACGKPVLAGASGGTPETLRDGETGYVVPCETPGPLAAAVTELFRDAPRRQCLGAAARHWVAEQFDWSVLSRQLADLFGQGEAADQPAAALRS